MQIRHALTRALRLNTSELQRHPCMRKPRAITARHDALFCLRKDQSAATVAVPLNPRRTVIRPGVVKANQWKKARTKTGKSQRFTCYSSCRAQGCSEGEDGAMRGEARRGCLASTRSSHTKKRKTGERRHQDASMKDPWNQREDACNMLTTAAYVPAIWIRKACRN